MEIITVDNDLPMFNSDLWTVGEDGQPVAPAAVAAAKEAVRGADAVAIFSPEYNYGVPPVTSNVIAWLSNQGNVLAGKPARVCSTLSPARVGPSEGLPVARTS
ncbi:hypothetical protein FNF31_07948 [Cafeteria roenbergensis]|uniref:NADPH-dependent FMN reductase-like domain-containing protein n=1 Tax=Cafeteria roenbergensis TaxID=33653 RepID=A0A5A8C169_CAFRO|nr:hypothetical protein FNF31_07948 [Cafeteria roenbergensis]